MRDTDEAATKRKAQSNYRAYKAKAAKASAAGKHAEAAEHSQIADSHVSRILAKG